jgi:hypothetical protein
MPKESEIRKKAIKILNHEGWICWFPAKARYKQNDIFGIIDLLAIKGERFKKIQLTTLANISTRRKKIRKFIKKNKVKLSVEIWAWSNKNKKFKIEKIKSS